MLCVKNKEKRKLNQLDIQFVEKHIFDIFAISIYK